MPSPSGVGPEIIKVLDFGISKIRGSQTVMTQDSTLLGTPQYMAPEQAVGQHESVDARTDIFALGAMFYELLSGSPPFSGQNIPEVVYKVVHVEEPRLTTLVPGLSEAQADAIHKALAKTQANRFKSVGEMVLAFTGSPLAADRSTSVQRISQDSMKDSLAAAKTLDSSKIDLAQAATVDSSKIDLAKAATVASHSTDIPAVVSTPEDLGAAATIDSRKLDKAILTATSDQSSSPAEVTATPDASKRGRLALVGGVALLAGAVGLFALTRSKSPDHAETKVTHKAAKGAKAAAAVAVVADEPAVPAIAIAIDAGVTPAVVIDAGAAAAGPPDAGKKARPKPSVEKLPVEKQVPAEVVKLLNEAQGHLDGAMPNTDKAIALARAANRLHRTPRGYALQAAAHCHNGDLPRFNQAVRKLAPSHARAARTSCKKFSQ